MSEEVKQTEPQASEININEITPAQALQFLTSAVRQLSFTYNEHVQFEQCRRVIAENIA